MVNFSRVYSQALYTLGILLQTTGASDDAAQSFQQSLSIYEQQLGADHESTADVRRALESCAAQSASAPSPTATATGAQQLNFEATK